MIVLDRFGKCRGQVDHDVALAECEIHVLEALQRSLELLDPFLHGDIEGGEGAWRHRSRRREAVARLKTFYASGEDVVVGTGRLVRVEIAADQQALAPQIVMRCLRGG